MQNLQLVCGFVLCTGFVNNKQKQKSFENFIELSVSCRTSPIENTKRRYSSKQFKIYNIELDLRTRKEQRHEQLVILKKNIRIKI